MPLEKEIGDGADALTVNQLRGALDGTYWVDGWGATPGTGDLEVDIAPGDGVVGGNDVLTEMEQTVDFAGDVDADDPRKAIISVDETGAVQKALGDPTPAEPDGEIRERTFNPAPPSDAEGAVVAEVWLGAGATAVESADIRDRRVSNRSGDQPLIFAQEEEPDVTPNPQPDGPGGIWYPVEAADDARGRLIRRHTTSDGFGGLVVSDGEGTLYYGGRDGEVVAQRISDGVEIFNNNVNGDGNSINGAAFENNLFYIKPTQGPLEGVAAITPSGNVEWESDSDERHRGNGILAAQGLVVNGNNDNQVVAYDAFTGETEWVNNDFDASMLRVFQYAENECFTIHADSQDGTRVVVGLEITTGDELWSTDVPDFTDRVVNANAGPLDDNVIFVISRDGELAEIDLNDDGAVLRVDTDFYNDRVNDLYLANEHIILYDAPDPAKIYDRETLSLEYELTVDGFDAGRQQLVDPDSLGDVGITTVEKEENDFFAVTYDIPTGDILTETEVNITDGSTTIDNLLPEGVFTTSDFDDGSRGFSVFASGAEDLVSQSAVSTGDDWKFPF